LYTYAVLISTSEKYLWI